MKRFKIKKAEFCASLKSVAQAKGDVFATIDGDTVVFAGCGENITIRSAQEIVPYYEKEQEKPATVGINAEVLIAALNAASDEEVKCSIDDSGLRITSETLSLKSPVKHGDILQEVTQDGVALSDDSAAKFASSVKAVEHATEKGNIPILNAVSISVFKDGSYRVVCTDGRRVSVRGNLSPSDAPEMSVCIDRTDADAMLSSLGGKIESLTVGNASVCAKTGSVSASVRTLALTFPDWEDFLSRRKETGKIDCSRSSLLASCKVCSLVSATRSGILDFSRQGITTSAEGEYGSAKNAVSVIGGQIPYQVQQKFDMLYLCDAAKALRDEIVTLSVAKSQSLVITNSAGLEMIMPMRMRN